jgi:hypothetical protein
MDKAKVENILGTDRGEPNPGIMFTSIPTKQIIVRMDSWTGQDGDAHIGYDKDDCVVVKIWVDHVDWREDQKPTFSDLLRRWMEFVARRP